MKQAQERGLDLSKIVNRRLLPVVESLLSNYKNIGHAIWETNKATDEHIKAAKRIDEGPKAAVERLSAAWGELQVQIGSAMDAMGATEKTAALTTLLDTVERAIRIVREISTLFGKQWLPNFKGIGPETLLPFNLGGAKDGAKLLRETIDGLDRLTRALKEKEPATFNERWDALPRAAPGGGGGAPGGGGGGAAPGGGRGGGGVRGGWRSGALGLPGYTPAAYHPGGGYRGGGPAPPMGAGAGAPEPEYKRDRSGKWPSVPWPMKDGAVGPGGNLILGPGGQAYQTASNDTVVAAPEENMRRYIRGIGFLETSCDPRQASGTEAGNTGYFRFNKSDAARAAKAGLPDPRVGSYEEQSAATAQYIDKFFPKAAAAIRSGNFAEAHRSLNKFWVSLPGGKQPQSPERYAQHASMLGAGGGGAMKAAGFGQVATPWGAQPMGPHRVGRSMTAGLPPAIAAQAHEMALMGPRALKQYMASVGHPQNDNWCGDFAAAAVEQAGGTPPKHPEVASTG